MSILPPTQCDNRLVIAGPPIRALSVEPTSSRRNDLSISVRPDQLPIDCPRIGVVPRLGRYEDCLVDPLPSGTPGRGQARTHFSARADRRVNYSVSLTDRRF